MIKKVNLIILLKPIQLILILMVGIMYSQSNNTKYQDYLSYIDNWK